VIRVALIGNPNCGKTTLFNALTGTHQRVGNWPGVTVEKKTGRYRSDGNDVALTDLPGVYSLLAADGPEAIDQRVARAFLLEESLDVVVNVVDASSLARGLYLTTELLDLDVPVVVALNMIDVAEANGIHVDAAALARTLHCPVVPIVAARRKGIAELKAAVAERAAAARPNIPVRVGGELADDIASRFRSIDAMLERTVAITPVRRTLTDVLDRIVLNRIAAFPIFLGVMYLMFMFTINVGSAFIDFFDLTAGALFVDGPRQIYMALGFPDWLIAFLADGVGGGVQLVATFIPVIACLFLFLSFLEDSGYMGRAAFIVDRLMRRLGLPGKSFVPLIVGFGCNVPAVMATRTLEHERDRILTVLMAPYMSCGARLTVYALFAVTFFPSQGQNIVFALYLIGIVVAMLSALVVRKFMLSRDVTPFVLELPAYHWPTLRGLALLTWHRLKGFVMRAGKAIVAVVIVLNVLSSVGTDGTFGNQDSDKSVIAAIGRTITPVFAPMGIREDNWPATVGLFTGIFAKEVVVGTLDSLYNAIATGNTPEEPEAFSLTGALGAAVATIPQNLAALADQAVDPLGIDLGNLQDTESQAETQNVTVGTIQVMRTLFVGTLAAFSYLVFILLYIPCAATVGAIYKELGGFWAAFSTLWSLVLAYTLAVVTFQIGQLAANPSGATLTILAMLLIQAASFTALIYWGRRRAPPPRMIPVVNLR
jgi:ferrous iron transport protein B